ncbi:hypothetical protein [Bradyrhizobium cosmicum]|uniref:hypothetical protein n=1 Tax=Bradyrhizobium cosmicum TaxID=1404864 RepID=UPI0028E67FF3|nr:hypothetical protein [Bradyrhizobium cosmicum]
MTSEWTRSAVSRGGQRPVEAALIHPAAQFLGKGSLVVDVLLDDLPSLLGARWRRRATEEFLAPLKKLAAGPDCILRLLQHARQVCEFSALPAAIGVAVADHGQSVNWAIAELNTGAKCAINLS